MDRQDLTIVRMLLISSNQNIVACVRETSFYCSHGQPRTTVLDASHYLIWSATDRRIHINSYGQPQTEVPHQLTWSARNYATRPQPFIKQLESTTMKGKFPKTAEFRRQRHGQVHPGATGGSTVPDASAIV